MPPKPIDVRICTTLPSAALLSSLSGSTWRCSVTTTNGETTIAAQWTPPDQSTVELPVGPFALRLTRRGETLELAVPVLLTAFIQGLPAAQVERGEAVWRLGPGAYGPIGVRGLASLTLVV